MSVPETPAIDELEAALEYAFRDRLLLVQALTHASAKTTTNPGNERLEFLGDAILGLIISEYLYHRYPDVQEGELTSMRSHVVSRKTLARHFQRMGLHAFMSLGKGLGMKSRIPESVLANMFEAVVAAVHIDGGYIAAKDFCLHALGDALMEACVDRRQKDHKSYLQRKAQKHLSLMPHYRVLDEVGPAHSRRFQVGVVLGEQEFPPAWGSSKKDAEQAAAARALKELDGGWGQLSEEDEDANPAYGNGTNDVAGSEH